MPELTICVPAAPYHKEAVNHAVASIQAQTIRCDYLVFEDHTMRGAGYARNQLLKSVKTPFVTFLDADDTLSPKFAENCLQVWGAVRGSERYVYTNWYGVNGRIFKAVAPCDMWKPVMSRQPPPDELKEDFDLVEGMWIKRTFHPVTTLIPTEYVRRIGGFDEQMTALEDSDFYKRLIISGVCGIHLNDPVFTYQPGGQRSTGARIKVGGVFPEQVMMEYMNSRYKDFTMGCCGDTPVQTKPEGDKYDGDVMAMALWAGNRQERGRVTGRIYPRASKPKIVYVDPLDVAASPNLWQKVSAMPNSQSPVLMPQYQQSSPLAQPGDWRTAGNAAFGGGQPQTAPQQPVSQDWQYKPVSNTREIADKLKIGQRKSE